MTSPSSRRDRHPPSIDRLARVVAAHGVTHPIAVDVARDLVNSGAIDHPDHGLEDIAAAAARRSRRALLGRVVNATGTLLHTNLGRAPFDLSSPADYRNLEIDLASGSRGSRHSHCARLFARLVDGDEAAIVNNGAAAVMLAVAGLGSDASVAVSRGELVEIGGGFRIPDVIMQTGARLVEVGTTNKTHFEDYRGAVEQGATAVLKVHRSNYTMSGFVGDVHVAELRRLGVPIVVDLGAGLIDERCGWLSSRPSWLGSEPGVRQLLDQGANLVTFSGDKLLGGPQAGIIVGDGELVASCVAHPLARVVRCGTHVLDGLQAVALSYLDGSAGNLPFWSMATRPESELRVRADRIAGAVTDLGTSCEVRACRSTPGGGALAGVEIPSVGVSLHGDVRHVLRDADTPVIARLDNGDTLCDLRTVESRDDDVLVSALTNAPTSP